MLKLSAPKGALQVDKLMTAIEKKANNQTISERKAADLFIKLTHVFLPHFKEAKLELNHRIPICAAEYAELETILEQKWKDEALIEVWFNQKYGLVRDFMEMRAFEQLPRPVTASEIRHWLNDTNNTIYLDQITGLDWQNLGLRMCPPEISCFHFLTYIDLSNNKLQYFPPTLSLSKNLKMLILRNNRLREFSYDFSNFKKLNTLELNKNKLTKFSCNFSGCEQLRTLQLDQNRLETATCDLSYCSNLHIIRLEDNELTSFSWNLDDCIRLKILRLNNNKLSSISSDISNHPLEWFNIYKNPIKKLFCIRGQLFGNGKVYHHDGSILEGSFIRNKLHGKGKITFTNGDICQATFDQGQMTDIEITFQEAVSDNEIKEENLGAKMWILPNDIIYEGNWPDGKGKIFLEDGNATQGEFVKGKFLKSKKRQSLNLETTSSIQSKRIKRK